MNTVIEVPTPTIVRTPLGTSWTYTPGKVGDTAMHDLLPHTWRFGFLRLRTTRRIVSISSLGDRSPSSRVRMSSSYITASRPCSMTSSTGTRGHCDSAAATPCDSSARGAAVITMSGAGTPARGGASAESAINVMSRCETIACSSTSRTSGGTLRTSTWMGAINRAILAGDRRPDNPPYGSKRVESWSATRNEPGTGPFDSCFAARDGVAAASSANLRARDRLRARPDVEPFKQMMHGGLDSRLRDVGL